jgi:hypothetical protein
MVSAEGFEPSTHALKEPSGFGLLRILNHLAPSTLTPIGTKYPSSGLNHHTNKHSRLLPLRSRSFSVIRVNR